jgi:hypothetical protein
MVVQRTGMVSSENPLSTTTRYYQNGYEAKNQTPSLANDKRNWGEGQRDHYIITGTESKNKPFAQNIDSHYSNFKGKKVDEIVEKPQPKQPKFK